MCDSDKCHGEPLTLRKLSVQLEWEHRHGKHVKNESGQNDLRENAHPKGMRSSQVVGTFKLKTKQTKKKKTSELFSIEIVKGGMRHGFLERS